MTRPESAGSDITKIERVGRVGKIQKILKLKNKDDILRWHIENLNLLEYVKSDACLNGGHVVFGKSGSGKTLFTLLAIIALIKNNPEISFAIVMLTKSSSAMSKFNAMQSLMKINLSNKILEYKSIDELKDFYDKLRKQARKKLTDPSTLEPLDIVDEHVVITPPSHYIFCIDDCLDELVSPKNTEFFTQFTSNHRHFNITVFYTLQQVAKISLTLKNNTRAVYLVGSFSQYELQAIHRGTLVADTISNFSDFKKFMGKKSAYIKDPNNSIIIFNSFHIKKPDNMPIIKYFKVAQEFATAVDQKEKTEFTN